MTFTFASADTSAYAGTPRRTVAPGVEPLSLSQAKAHLRVDIADDDTLISEMIGEAREYCEELLSQSFVTQTWKQIYDRFPGGVWRLPRPPLLAVTSIKYYDTANVQQTLSAAVYEVDAQSMPGRLRRAVNYSWPAIYPRLGGIEIIWTAGYGATAASVPGPIKRAIRFVLGEWYEERQPRKGGDTEFQSVVWQILQSVWNGNY